MYSYIVGTVYLILALLTIKGFAITYKNIAFITLLPWIYYQSFTILASLRHTQWSTQALPQNFLYGMYVE